MLPVRDTAAPGLPRARRVQRILVEGSLWCVLAVLLWFVWPAQLGGCTTLTIVSGRSMEPTLRTGDLVVSRCGAPAVGDVVVYATDDTQGGRIIHRIVGGDTAGWVLRGDNNPTDDPFRPASDEILGRAALHVPRVGSVLTTFAHPLVWLSCLLLAAACLLWPDRAPRTSTSEEDEEVDV